MSTFLEFLFTFTLALGASVLAYIVLGFLSSRPTKKQSAVAAFRAQRIDKTFYIFVASYAIISGAPKLLSYLSFSTPTFDLAQYDQLIWNSLCGRLLENSYVPDAPQFLGKSFTPILLALVPLYTLWSNPITLLIVQTLAMSVASFPIYWFARERLGYPLALVLAVAYFLFPAAWYANFVGFSDIGLAVPLLALATYFMLRRRYVPFLVCLGVALLVKEEIAFVAVGFGVFVFLFQGKRALGFGIALFATAFAMLLLVYVIPYFRGANAGDFYYFGSGTFAGGGGRYGYLGHSISEIVVTLVTRPDVVLQHLFIPGKIEYLLHMLVPLAFVPLVGADVAILALPTLGYTLLSDYQWQYDIQSLYPAPLVPFVFFSAIVGLQRILTWWKATSFKREGQQAWRNNMPITTMAVLILVSSGLSYLFQVAVPFTQNFQAADFTVSSGALAREAMLRSIPYNAFVVAQDEFLAHVSNRQVVHEIPAIADYRQADYVVYDTTREWYGVHGGYWNMVVDSGYFEPLVQKDGFVLAKRRELNSTLQFTFAGQIKLLGYAIPLTNTVEGGTIIRPILNWQAIKGISARYFVTLQVEDEIGHVWANEDVEPRDGSAPTIGWQAGSSLMDQYALNLPPTMPSGNYQVTVGLHKLNAEDNLAVVDKDGTPVGSEAVIATLRVQKNKNSFTASDLQIEQPLIYDMGEMRLLGFVPPRQTITPGELLQVGIYWRARARPQGDYVVAVQLTDARGRIAFEQSSKPANGTYPTTQWSAGEVLLDWHDFTIPTDLSKGVYQIAIELRNGKDNSKLGAVAISSILIGGK